MKQLQDSINRAIRIIASVSILALIYLFSISIMYNIYFDRVTKKIYFYYQGHVIFYTISSVLCILFFIYNISKLQHSKKFKILLLSIFVFLIVVLLVAKFRNNSATENITPLNDTGSYYDVVKDLSNYTIKTLSVPHNGDLYIEIKNTKRTFVTLIIKSIRFMNFDLSISKISKSEIDLYKGKLIVGSKYASKKPLCDLTMITYNKNIINFQQQLKPEIWIDRNKMIDQKIIENTKKYQLIVVFSKCARLYFDLLYDSDQNTIDFVFSPNDLFTSNLFGNLGLGILYNKISGQSYLFFMAYDREKEFTWDVFYDFYNALNIERILEL